MIRRALEALRDQPAHLLRLCLVEMAERFGFVTMVGIMALFLVAPGARGGLGWSNASALLLMAWYAALLFITPLVGGWLSDRFFGPRRSILIGGVMMALGYLCLGALPQLLGSRFGVGPQLAQLMFHAKLPLAQLSPPPEAWQRLVTSVESALSPAGVSEVLAHVRRVYDLQTVLLGAALSLVIAGNALFKPSVSALVGLLYSPCDPRRDSGFTLFWTCINAGSFLAYVIGGGLSERLGWNIGFLVASAGTTCALVYFQRAVRHLPKAPQPTPAVALAQVTFSPAETRKRVGAILVMTAFAALFNANQMQLLGLVGLFMLQDVDRLVFGFEVPTLWITAINPIVILLLAPIAALLWEGLARRGRNPSAPAKFAMALFILAAGEFVLVMAATQADGPGKAALAMVAVAVVAMSVAEIPLQPIGLSMVTSVTPPRLVGMMIGVWLLSFGVGGGVGNAVGSLASTIGVKTVFAIGAVSCLVGGASLLVLRRTLVVWMGQSIGVLTVTEDEPVRQQ